MVTLMEQKRSQIVVIAVGVCGRHTQLCSGALFGSSLGESYVMSGILSRIVATLAVSMASTFSLHYLSSPKEPGFYLDNSKMTC